jgi:hypothetical protein
MGANDSTRQTQHNEPWIPYRRLVWLPLFTFRAGGTFALGIGYADWPFTRQRG